MPQPDETNKPSLIDSDFRGRVVSHALPAVDIGLPDSESLTYERYFGLREKPFSLSPDPRFFFTNPSRRATFDALVAGIRRREGILALTGETGTGKTTLCRAVLQSLDRKTFAAFVPDPFLSREDLLKILLVDFGVISMDEIRSGRLQGATRTDLSYRLYDFLTSPQPVQTFAVVMIDEAQNLSTQLLEEIRILADLETRQRLLQIFFIGQPQLGSHLGTPEMRQLNQRVSVRCELLPLARPDVGPYISHRLAVAGNSGALEFTEPAIELVYRASSGIPRVINLVCDGALLRAARSRRMIVGDGDILGAIDELKLPVARNLHPLSLGNHLEFPSEQPDAPPAPASGEFHPRPINQSMIPTTYPAAENVNVPPQPSFRGQRLFGDEIRKTPVGAFWRTSTAEVALEENGAFAQDYWAPLLAVVIALLAVTTIVVGYYSLMR